MTVSTTLNRKTYTGDAVSTVFAFPYKFLATTDLHVYVGGVLKTLNVDYTVGTPSDLGANITFVSAPASGASIVIISDPDLLQSSALPSTGPFPSLTVERMVDKVTLQVQRLKDLFNRSLSFSDADVSGASSTLPTPVSRRALVWASDGLSLINSTYDPDTASAAADTATAAAASATATYQQFHGQYYGPLAADPAVDPYGNPLAAGDIYTNTATGILRVYTGSAWADSATATPVNYNTQLFNGTGAQTAFTLSSAPASLLATEVFLSGVRQRNTTDYTVSGTTLTFVSAPAAGTNNIFVRWTNAISVGVPNNKSVTYGKIQDVPNQRLLGRNTAGAGDVEEVTLTQLLDWIGSAARGDILYRGASAWARLAAGTVGQVLKTGGVGADPSWSNGLVQMSSVAVSGTSVDFTGIPGWAKRITVMFRGVSTSGTAELLVKLGIGTGIISAGYISSASTQAGTVTSSTAGFIVTSSASASDLVSGQIVISAMGANVFVESSVVKTATNAIRHGAGDIALSDVLTQLRITTTNGTDTFDAGTVNVMYE